MKRKYLILLGLAGIFTGVTAYIRSKTKGKERNYCFQVSMMI